MILAPYQATTDSEYLEEPEIRKKSKQLILIRIIRRNRRKTEGKKKN